MYSRALYILNGIHYPHQVGQNSDVHDGNVNEAALGREASLRLSVKGISC